MVYVAFVTDIFARKIVGGRVSNSMTTGFVLDALNQAIWQRAPSETGMLINHSERGSQYLSIRYTERLAEAGIVPAVAAIVSGTDGVPRRPSAIPTTTPWQKASSACSRSRTSSSSAPGSPLVRSNGKP